MRVRIVASLLPLALASACATVHEPASAFVPSAAPAERRSEVVIEASAPAAEPHEPAPAQGTRRQTLDAAQIALLNSPDFRRRFVESYASETDVEPRPTVGEIEKLQDVVELVAAERLDDAARALRELRGPAATAVVDYTLGNVFFQQERLEHAIGAYRVAVDKFPRFRRAWRNLGICYVRAGDFANALPALTKVVELGGADPVTYGLLGYGYSAVGNDLAAESAYRMAILLDPDTVDFEMGLVRALFMQRRYAEAVALCDTLIADRPDSADLWILQANAYIGAGQPMRAAENYELVDRLGGSTAETLTNLGDIYVNGELFELAVDAYERAMALDPELSPERMIRAAKVMTGHGALAETRSLTGAIELALGEQLDLEAKKDLLKLRSRLAVAAGESEEEARVLEEIVELDPLDGEAILLLGQHARRTGDDEKALFWFERAAMLEEHEADASVRIAQVLVVQKRYDEALRKLRRAQDVEYRDNVQDFLEQVESAAKTR